MKVEFSLKELSIIYNNVLSNINMLESPVGIYFEEISKEEQLERLKENQEYNTLIALKEKLEKITFTFKIIRNNKE